MARRNLAVFGEHPTTLLERDGSAVDITDFSLSSLSGASFRLVLLTTTTAAKGGGASDDVVWGAEVLPQRFRFCHLCKLCCREAASAPGVSVTKKEQASEVVYVTVVASSSSGKRT
jgi:hypothetical protein